MGFSFKENCPDFRNTRIIDVHNNFEKLGCRIDIYDPYVSKVEVNKEFNINLINEPEKSKYDVIIMAVAHEKFKQYSLIKLKEFAKKSCSLIAKKFPKNIHNFAKTGSLLLIPSLCLIEISKDSQNFCPVLCLSISLCVLYSVLLSLYFFLKTFLFPYTQSLL